MDNSHRMQKWKIQIKPSCTQCCISALTNLSILYWVPICGSNKRLPIIFNKGFIQFLWLKYFVYCHNWIDRCLNCCISLINIFLKNLGQDYTDGFGSDGSVVKGLICLVSLRNLTQNIGHLRFLLDMFNWNWQLFYSSTFTHYYVHWWQGSTGFWILSLTSS